MIDHAFALLVPTLNNLQGRVLWLVDENISAEAIARIKPRAELKVISNRFDSVSLLRRAGFSVQLSDFDFFGLEACYDAVVYRISKEKALVHHIINSSMYCLVDGGNLLLSGYKNEGIKTYTKKAGQLLGETVEKQRGNKSAQCVTLCNSGGDSQRLEDKDYSEIRRLEVDKDTVFYSKPGVFGWEKIDRGSQFLIEQLPVLLEAFPHPPRSAVDLGCGYGYLSLKLATMLDTKITAVDNNIAAVNCCRKNFQASAIDAEVDCDDCGDSLQAGFDLLLCNPPFHQGFDLESDLSDKFIAASHRLLGSDGKAVFVVNAFIPLERKAKGLYARVDVVANNKSFKVLLLSKT